MISVRTDREVYPGAPLKLVACEVSYQLAPGADLDAAAAPFYDAVDADYPLPGPAPAQEMRLEVGPSGSTHSVVSHGFRFLSNDRTRSVAVSPTALIVETSTYTRFEDFADAVVSAVEALESSLRVAAVTRVGLRYIDEVPLAHLPDGDLAGYFADDVLAAGRLVEGIGEPDEFLTTTSYSLGEDRRAVVRTGRVAQPIVVETGPLAIAQPSSPPLFVIDVDCAWQAKTTLPEVFDRESIGRIVQSLHAPVRTLFESSITEKLRDEVLRKDPAL